MDLYLVSAALLIDRTTVMITKADEALPGYLPWDGKNRVSPEWAVALNAMSLASGVFYLLLCLWMAMYASISAQSFGTRLLTQFVRLPTASQYNVAKATATALQYEDKDFGEMLRVPVIQAGGAPSTTQIDGAAASTAASLGEPDPDPAMEGVSFLGRLPSSNGYITNPTFNILPSAMLDHIRLYRRVQLNWQAYDAYARVSLFCGANSLLYSCLYWSLGSFLTGQHAGVAAVAVATIFATIQVMLAKLDLRLRSWQVRRVALLLGLTPISTTVGMFLYADLQESKLQRGPFCWQRLLMNFCAITAHVLHTVVAYMVLLAAWPDTDLDHEEALLPSKFRSTLYLDVFGWLLNPTGPGPRRAEREEEDDEGSYPSVCTGSHQSQDTANGEASIRPQTVEGVAQSTTARPKRSRWMAASESFRGSSEASTRPSRRTSRASLQVPAAFTSQSFTEGATQRLLEARRPQGGLWNRLRRSFSSSVGDPNDGVNNFTPELEREVRRAFPSPTSSFRGGRISPSNPSGSGDTGSQVDRFGGNEALTFQDMQAMNDPAAATAANFMGSDTAPRNVSQKKALLPGQRPWKAFKRGTEIIVILWTASVCWAIYKAVYDIYEASIEKKDAITRHLVEGISEAAFFSPALCEGIQHELRRSSDLMPHLTQWTPWSQVTWPSKVPACGGWETAEDMSLTCDEARCVVAVLQRGGREVTLCNARSATTTTLPQTWIVPSSMSSLRTLALQMTGDSFHLYARTQDALLLLKPAEGAAKNLRPVLEVEMFTQPSSSLERLLVLNGVLFSLRQDASCEGAAHLTAWKLDTGVKFDRMLSTEAASNLTFCAPMQLSTSFL